MFLKKNMFVLLLFCAGKIFSQSVVPAQWFKKAIVESNIVQYFPDSATVSGKQIYTDSGTRTITEYTSKDKLTNAIYSLSIRTLTTKKEYKSALKEEVQRFVLQYGAYPEEKSIKDSSGEMITEIMIHADKLIIKAWIRVQGLYMYIQCVQNDTIHFSDADAQVFFKSLFFVKNEITVIEKPTSLKTPDINWMKTENENFSVLFPRQVEYKTYYIKNGSGKDYSITNYLAKDKATGIIYQLTERNYDMQVTPSAQWLNYQVQNLVKEKKLTLVSSKLCTVNGKVLIADYVFGFNKQLYKIRYILTEKMLYQLSAVSTKKSINHKNNAYFFENFVLKK